MFYFNMQISSTLKVWEQWVSTLSHKQTQTQLRKKSYHTGVLETEDWNEEFFAIIQRRIHTLACPTSYVYGEVPPTKI